MEEDACCVAYTTSIFIHQPLLRLFFPGEEDSTAAVFPAAERQMYRHRSWLPIARVKFSCRRNNAIRHRDSVKSDEENVFTRDRLHSDSRSVLLVS